MLLRSSPPGSSAPLLSRIMACSSADEHVGFVVGANLVAVLLSGTAAAAVVLAVVDLSVSKSMSCDFVKLVESISSLDGANDDEHKHWVVVVVAVVGAVIVFFVVSSLPVPPTPPTPLTPPTPPATVPGSAETLQPLPTTVPQLLLRPPPVVVVEVTVVRFVPVDDSSSSSFAFMSYWFR